MEGGTDRIYFDLKLPETEAGTQAEATARANTIGMQKRFYVKVRIVLAVNAVGLLQSICVKQFGNGEVRRFWLVLPSTKQFP